MKQVDSERRLRFCSFLSSCVRIPLRLCGNFLPSLREMSSHCAESLVFMASIRLRSSLAFVLKLFRLLLQLGDGLGLVGGWGRGGGGFWRRLLECRNGLLELVGRRSR